MDINTTYYGRRHLLLSYLILATIGISTFFIHGELSGLRREMKQVIEIPKIKISNSEQFTTMCEQFTNQWGGKYFAFYILQPNSTYKTYKEKSIVSDEVTEFLPNRTPITTPKLYSLLDGIGYAKVTQSGLDDILPGNQVDDKFNIVVIPINQNDVVVGELYIFYDLVDNMESIESHVAEAQLLTQLLY